MGLSGNRAKTMTGLPPSLDSNIIYSIAVADVSAF
jgi:hypothetical protein